MSLPSGQRVTVRVVDDEMLPDVAVIVVLPSFPVAVASPSVLMVAMEVSDDVHATPFVMSFNVPSLKIPEAENCCDPCVVILGFVGETWIEVSGEVRMVTVVEPLTPRSLAEMVADPGATVVAIPFALIKTKAALELVQTGDLSTPVLPST
jgi:hypothetical protein